MHAVMQFKFVGDFSYQFRIFFPLILHYILKMMTKSLC